MAFYKAVAGTFVGKILAALFIAVCLVLGVGPDKWAAFVVSDLPLTPGIAQLGFVALAMLTFAAAFGPAIWRKLRPPPPQMIPIAFEIKGPVRFDHHHPWIDLDGPLPQVAGVRIFRLGHVIFTNTCADRNVALEISLHLKGKDGRGHFRLMATPEGPFGRILGVSDKTSMAARKAGILLLPSFKSPETIRPQRSLETSLDFIMGIGPEIIDDFGVRVANEFYDYELDVVDRISGATLTLPIPGEYRGK